MYCIAYHTLNSLGEYSEMTGKKSGCDLVFTRFVWPECRPGLIGAESKTYTHNYDIHTLTH